MKHEHISLCLVSNDPIIDARKKKLNKYRKNGSIGYNPVITCQCEKISDFNAIFID